jgi:Carbohydrate binding module (family 6)./Bacterial Ig-like domain (group 2).
MNTRYITCGFYLMLAIGMAGCEDYIRTPVTKNIFVNKQSITAFVGEEVQLNASPTDGTYQYQWNSENPEVATVTSDGLVKMVGEGFTNIVVSSGEIKTKVEVNAVVRIPLEDVLFSENALEMVPGDKKIIIVTRVPEAANDLSEAFWISDNPEIAAVNELGEITALGEGATSITYKIGGIEKKVAVDIAFTRPFKGPHVLSAAQPYVLPAANFDLGGQGHAFNDDGGNPLGQDNYRRANGDTQSLPVEIEGDGTNIGYINAGEWLVYTVDVRDGGEYLVDVSLSAAGDGMFHLEVDNQNVTGSVHVPNNGSWADWRWHPNPPLTVNFTAGKHKIKFVTEVSGFNLNSLRFIKK